MKRLEVDALDVNACRLNINIEAFNQFMLYDVNFSAQFIYASFFL